MIRNNIIDALYDFDVVVAGGMVKKQSDESYDTMAINSVEIYKASENAWRSGPDLPVALFGAAMVQYSSDQVML